MRSSNEVKRAGEENETLDVDELLLQAEETVAEQEGAPVVEGLPHLWAEVVHAVRHEMARSVDDVLTRRLPLRWLDARGAMAAAEGTADLVGRELGWDDARRRAEASDYVAAVAHDLPVPA